MVWYEIIPLVFFIILCSIIGLWAIEENRIISYSSKVCEDLGMKFVSYEMAPWGIGTDDVISVECKPKETITVLVKE